MMKIRLPSLEDVPLWVRVAIAVAAIVAAILLLLMAQTGGQHLVLTLPSTKWDAEMLELERRALQEAYVEKMKQLFGVWVTSGLEDPQRPVKGAAQTRRAFIEIKKIQEVREQELEDRQQK